MADAEDILDISGMGKSPARNEAKQPQRFLSVWYRCCNTYGRLYRNRQQTAYIGRCPKCGAQVQALIGPGGTSRRCFEAQ